MANSPQPQFLVIGAPRCGTTSLHDKLSRHPDIFMSAVKEPHFFASFDFPFPENEIHHVTHDKKVYQQLFAGAGNKLTGESSTYYLADPAAPANIAAYNPKMKLIAILRDPVDRAYSQYLQHARRGQQAKSFTQTMNDLLAGEAVPAVYDLVMLGRYGEQLQRYYAQFSKDQILVVMFDDLTQRPVETLTQILKFLEVDTSLAVDLAKAEAQNQHQVPRSQLLAKVSNNQQVMKIGLKVIPRPLLRLLRNKVLLKKGDHKEPLDADMVQRLRATYAADNKILAKLLHRSVDQLWTRS
ncbi:MAG TPA: sulfotransferase [Candidatus Saccharimonadales bacterium]|nr:sulfotransferase [Candidatus Saccharimonadales bacterium]